MFSRSRQSIYLNPRALFQPFVVKLKARMEMSSVSGTTGPGQCKSTARIFSWPVLEPAWLSPDTASYVSFL